MEIKVGEPIILIYQRGAVCSQPLYYLGQHVYGDLTDNGFRACGIIDDIQYVVPYRLLNDNYMRIVEAEGYPHGKTDTDRFKDGYQYNDFLPCKVVDVEAPYLQEHAWYNDMMESIKHVREFYGLK